VPRALLGALPAPVAHRPGPSWAAISGANPARDNLSGPMQTGLSSVSGSTRDNLSGPMQTGLSSVSGSTRDNLSGPMQANPSIGSSTGSTRDNLSGPMQANPSAGLTQVDLPGPASLLGPKRANPGPVHGVAR
jgi:hypothetical protein